MFELLLAVVLFMTIMMALSLVIVGARSVLVMTGNVDVIVNEERVISLLASGPTPPWASCFRQDSER
jgi:Na+-transporting NADH:ubiquinone oxidoreductase subunit F